jgi:preprotein translocase SecE subunit
MAREADLPRPVPRKPRDEARPAGEVERHGNFVMESIAELKKVEWPSQNQVIQGTVVVLIACAIVGVFLYLNDQLWKEVVQRLFLGQ